MPPSVGYVQRTNGDGKIDITPDRRSRARSRRRDGSPPLVDGLGVVGAWGEEEELGAPRGGVAAGGDGHRAPDAPPACPLEDADARDLGEAVERRRGRADRDRLAVEETEQRRAAVVARGALLDVLLGGLGLVVAERAPADGEVRAPVVGRRDDEQAGDLGRRRRAPGRRRSSAALAARARSRPARARRRDRARSLRRTRSAAAARAPRNTARSRSSGSSRSPADGLVRNRVVEVAQRVARVEETRERRHRHGLVEAASRLPHVGLDSRSLAHRIDYRLCMAVETRVAPELLRTQAYVDGAWIDADSGETFPVVDPATGDTVPRCRGWARPRPAARSRLRRARSRRGAGCWPRSAPGSCARFADLMMEHQEDLSVLMTLEQGKPLAESRAEIAYAASFFEWFGEEAKRVYGDTIPAFAPRRRILVLKQPVGVTVGITPWNFPAAMITRKAAPALAAGCTMVVKPASQTPLSALAIAELGERAGLPAGRPERRHGRLDGDRRRDDLEPDRPQARLHGLDRGREAAHGAVRPRREEGLARAGRQRAVHRLRRRRPRRRHGGARARSSATPARRASRRTGSSSRRASSTRLRRA